VRPDAQTQRAPRSKAPGGADAEVADDAAAAGMTSRAGGEDLY
jgi:hypothetical protein